MTVDSLSLKGKIAIITGSGRENGIGAGIAKALARNGAAVAINYVSESSTARAAEVVSAIEAEGGKVVAIRADVSTVHGTKELVSETLKAFKTDKIDILVNNAGTGSPHTSLDVSEDAIMQIFKVNVFGMIFLAQAAVPHMGKGGRIINIGSVAAKLGLPVMPIYGASKAALDSLTYSWAREFGASKGITVNTIAPGPVFTDMGLSPDEAETALKVLLDATRLERRLGDVSDISDAVLLLAQEKSRWITGQHISVSGGITGQ